MTSRTADIGPRARLERDVFNALPYGLLVLDRAGRVLCRNLAATRLLGGALATDGELTCCALLGCRRPGTVLESGCLTELAIATSAALPEVRVDLRAPAGVTSMWVAAAPLGRGARAIVLQLRPGMADDRRQRTEARWKMGPRLRISSLGRTAVHSAEGSLGGRWLDQRAGQLLKYLLAERHRAVTVDEIAENVWTNADYRVASSVRYYVHALRARLEPRRARRESSAFIRSTGGGYRLDLDRVEVDADEFEAHLSAGLAAAATDPNAAVAQIERGMNLYEGDFLGDVPYAEWAIPERQRLHELACTGLRATADLHLGLDQLDAAAGALQRLAGLQPYDEEVHRRTIELDMLRGQRSDAVRRYAALRWRMRREFGDEPSFTPADLVPTRQPVGFA
jgi:DNA-binding SARP family transcriptional activator